MQFRFFASHNYSPLGDKRECKTLNSSPKHSANSTLGTCAVFILVFDVCRSVKEDESNSDKCAKHHGKTLSKKSKLCFKVQLRGFQRRTVMPSKQMPHKRLNTNAQLRHPNQTPPILYTGTCLRFLY